MTGQYKTFREAYDLRKSLGLAEDVSFRLDVSWVSGPFAGAHVTGILKYNDLSDEPRLLSTLPVFNALLPNISKKMYDKVARNINAEGGTEEVRRTKASMVLLMSSTPTLLYKDEELYSHPLVNSWVPKVFSDAITYEGGDVQHIDGKSIDESTVTRLKVDWEGPRVYVDPLKTTVHPKQIRPNHDDLLNHKAAEREKKVTACGLTREELAKNGLGVPDFY